MSFELKEDSKGIVTKPVVYFGPSRYSACLPTVGESHSVYAYNHPVLGEMEVHTSTVAEVFPDGSFDTLNTHYTPVTPEFFGDFS